MKHFLNVCDINGADVEPVDVITFGSPCQDMSIAGKREGIKHSEHGDEETTRSGLFYEAIRIIKEMREATHGEYPKYAVWENVPGAFSSNKGWDFLAVLEALCSVCDSTVSVPEPHDKKRPDKLVWLGAGEIVGDNFSVCWRTLDAQYWGVPQRRKRIYLVADFNTRCAREILFKSDSLRGNLPQGNGERKTTAADAVGSVDGSIGNSVAFSFDSLSSNSMKSKNPISGCREVDVAKCLDTAYPDPSKNQGGIAIVECLNPWDCQSKRIFSADGVYPTLPAMDCGGANNQAVISLQGNGIDRSDTAGCNGCGWRENEMYTLNTVDRPEVCYDARGNGDGETVLFEPRLPDGEPRIYDDICPTLNTAQGGQRQPCIVENSKPPRRYIIRRLMPVECARLQGFPDRWGELAPFNPDDTEFWESVRKTYAEISGKKYKPVKNLKKWYDKLHNDGAEYKMWGNGIALPCAEYILHEIAEHGAKTLGSLFDGSGGFPLAGAINGITPLWSSEVEPYPIAVTKSRFI